MVCAVPAAAAVLDHHAEAAGIADAGDRRRRCDEDEPLADRGQFLEQLALDGGGRLHGVVRALLERVKRHEDGAGIGRVGEGRAGEADDVHGVRDAGDRERDFGRLAVDLIGAGRAMPPAAAA